MKTLGKLWNIIMKIELHISCRVRKEVHAVTFTIISLLFSNESSTKVSQFHPMKDKFLLINIYFKHCFRAWCVFYLKGSFMYGKSLTLNNKWKALCLHVVHLMRLFLPWSCPHPRIDRFLCHKLSLNIATTLPLNHETSNPLQNFLQDILTF